MIEDQPVHTFHIPVMGTGFTIDTPVRVAKYGISSVVSLVDDTLIEQMRRYHAERMGEAYEPIGDRDEDHRARRITGYLDLLNRIVRRQIEEIRSAPFEPESEITRYFELLPDGPLRRLYLDMLETKDPAAREALQAELRRRIVPGRIDVNIMTKLDRDAYRGTERLGPEYSDALSAMRGFALSGLDDACIVLSAGMNPRLYTYASQFEDFYPDESGYLKKKLCLKVSDYRSALIQGKFLAKRGLWVTEYRIESGLNCGGHAFATKGYLMGPILEEFRTRGKELVDSLHEIYRKALVEQGRADRVEPLAARVTVQGGIGTAEEDELLRRHFGVYGTGWGTPFLLVPEVTNVDDEQLTKLVAANEEDVFLSGSSPLGIPFWNLRSSSSEQARRGRIEAGRPGSPCPKGHAVTTTEFAQIPQCVAARAYQRRKLEDVERNGTPGERLARVREEVMARSCICHDLAGGATLKLGIDPKATPAVCPGPGIADFSKVVTLAEMVGHIYGRLSLVTNPDRPHMFIRELKLYVRHLREEVEKLADGIAAQKPKYFEEFRDNLHEGVEFYRRLVPVLSARVRERFSQGLESLMEEIRSIEIPGVAETTEGNLGRVTA